MSVLLFFQFCLSKVSKYEVISGPYFPVFSLNTGKYGPVITPYLDTFHAVEIVRIEDLKRACFLFEPTVIHFLFSCNYAPTTLKKKLIRTVIVAAFWIQVTSFNKMQWRKVTVLLYQTELEICQNTGFVWTVFSRTGSESAILSLYRNIRFRGNPYSSLFYAVRPIFP